MKTVTTDSCLDDRRYRVAKRQDGQYAVFDTEHRRTISIHKYYLDALAWAAQVNDEDAE